MKEWYKSKLCKGILILALHVAVVGIIIIFLEFFNTGRNADLSFFGNYLLGEDYEDTVEFEERMLYLSYEKAKLERYRPYFEEDFLEGRVLDITIPTEYLWELEDRSTIGNYEVTDGNISTVVTTITEDAESVRPSYVREEDIGILYNIEELVEWSETNAMSYDMGKMIVVCQDSNGEYDYYYYDEFERFVQEQKFQLVSDFGEETSKTILRDMQNGMYADWEGSEIRVLDEHEEVKYMHCWTLYERLDEKFLPINGKSLLEIATNSTHWNGRLRELIEELQFTLDTLNRERQSYEHAKENMKEESNLSYIFVDLKNEQVYSNVREYTNFGEYEANIAELKKSSKYIKVAPKDRSVESNLRVSGWSFDLDFQYLVGDDYIYIAAINLPLTVQDDFYEQKIAYESAISPRIFIGMTVMFFVALICLTIVAGRKAGIQEVVLNKFDSIKTELACGIIVAMALAFMFVIWMPVGVYVGEGHAYYYHYNYSRSQIIIVGIFVSGICAICLTGYLSLVRRIKAKTLWKNSVLKCLWKYAKVFGGFCKEVFQNRRSTTKVIVIAGVIFLLGFAGVAFQFLELFVLSVVACVAFVVQELRIAIATQKIRDGLKAITEGNIDHQIPVEKMFGDQKEIAERINSMGEGLERAIEKSIKDERLKTELITNVSHDIKTPLTSIINYVDLLKRENFKDEKIQGYLKILEEKAQRLKALTEDVMEASKVTSGNIKLEFAMVNLVEMIRQSEGEFERRFKTRNLELVMDYPKEVVTVNVDGKYMWRVLENLFVNVEKYAMAGTRVYGELKIHEGKAIFSIKNISAIQLNITAEELAERFIRGDEARSTEGSGLGLSIAKSLVELQGGTLSLEIDGDLFKATVAFSHKTIENE